MSHLSSSFRGNQFRKAYAGKPINTRSMNASINDNVIMYTTIYFFPFSYIFFITITLFP